MNHSPRHMIIACFKKIFHPVGIWEKKIGFSREFPHTYTHIICLEIQNLAYRSSWICCDVQWTIASTPDMVAPSKGWQTLKKSLVQPPLHVHLTFNIGNRRNIIGGVVPEEKYVTVSERKTANNITPLPHFPRGPIKTPHDGNSPHPCRVSTVLQYLQCRRIPFFIRTLWSQKTACDVAFQHGDNDLRRTKLR